MAKVFELMVKPEKAKGYKAVKNFDATINAEQRIASALYEGYAKIKGKGTVLITKYYEDGYGFYSVENGEFRIDVTSDSEVENYNHELIGQLFNAYKIGTQKPLKITEAYTFLKEPREKNLRTLQLKTTLRFDYRTFETFIANVLAYPQKYSKKVYEVCKLVYGNRDSLYSTPITEDMVLYPSWLQPRGFEQERITGTTWKMSAELDGQIVEYQVTYDAKGISKFGPVGSIELAGKLVEVYVHCLIEDAYKGYTENNLDYKIIQVVNSLNRYIEYVRGEDFRANYDKTGGKMKEPCEFIVDMTDLLHQMGDKRFTKEDIYTVINYFKNNKSIFDSYYEHSNKCMEKFYPWFAERMSKGQKLFKNVPK